MKKYLILLLAFLSFSATADTIGINTTSSNIYYVSPAANGGNDANNCSASKPCLTLAGTAAKVTKAGSIIHMNTKLGSFAETVTTNLAVGVTLECDGSQYNAITSNIPLNNTIQLISTVEGTQGNQEIRYCSFTGNLVGIQGIYIQGRSNVKVHDNVATTWLSQFIVFNGRSDNTFDFAPKKLATGNEFYNNVVTNSSRYLGSGSGSLAFGGQDGIKIWGNNIDVSGRGTSAVTGWPIKYYSGGYSKNEKIYNNILTKPDYDGTGGFAFTIEYWHGLGGTEIYGNTLTGGGIDVNISDKGSTLYTMDFHDNVVSFATLWAGGGIPFGFQVEYNVSDIIVRNNLFYNFGASGRAIAGFNPNEAGQQYNNYRIFNNIVVDSKLLDMISSNIATRFDNWLIANNTVYHKTVGSQAINIPSGGRISNIMIRNNIVTGFTTSAVELNGSGTLAFVDNLSVENNLFFGNGNSNTFKNTGANAVTNLIERGTVTTDPLFIDVTNGVVATSMAAGRLYFIRTAGTTDYTTANCGSPSNTVGTLFKVKTSCLGTGTADALDLRIAVGSPARSMGLDVGIGSDYIGIIRTNTPDAGALEYDERGARVNLPQPQLTY